MMACVICKKPVAPSPEPIAFDSDEKPHVCNICRKSFSLKIQLKRHVLSHETSPVQIYCSCEKQQMSYNLRLSKKGNFICETCEKCFNTKRLLLRHASEHTLENILKCDECGDCFKNMTALKKHSVTHKTKRNIPTGNVGRVIKKPYVCEDCGESFIKPQQLVDHSLTHRKYKCKICKVHFSTNTLLQNHRKYDCRKSNVENTASANTSSLNTDSSNSVASKHICSVCNKSFTRKSALEGHYISHYDESRESPIEDDSDKDVDFQCNFKKDKSIEPLERLCLPKLKIRRSFPCEKCDIVCSSQNMYSKHLMSHETNKEHLNKKSELKKTYVCRICSDMFDSKENYKRHKTSHNTELPKEKIHKTYTCQICNKVFSKKKHFKKHFKTHSEDNANESNSLSSEEFQSSRKAKRTKRFCCSFCGQLFAGETCWKKHEKKHENNKDDPTCKPKKGKQPKNLICEYCNEDFTGKRHIFLKHKLSHTPEVCGICDARFTDRASLREHCRIHIGTEEGRKFLECSQKALDAKNGVVQAEPKVEYIYLVLR